MEYTGNITWDHVFFHLERMKDVYFRRIYEYNLIHEIHYSGSPLEFEDIYWGFCAKMYSNYHKYKPTKGNMTSWLFILFKNYFIDKCRSFVGSSHVIPSGSSADLPDISYVQIGDTQGMEEDIKKALTLLTPQETDYLSRYLSGDKVRQICFDLDEEPSKVKTNIGRARSKIYNYLFVIKGWEPGCYKNDTEFWKSTLPGILKKLKQ